MIDEWGRLVVMLSVSLDGFFEAPAGDISWHHVTEDLHRDMNAVLGASAGLLNGRRNWELMAGFWPDLAPDEPEAMQEFCAIWKGLSSPSPPRSPPGSAAEPEARGAQDVRRRRGATELRRGAVITDR